jgi:hypothetical protein
MAVSGKTADLQIPYYLGTDSPPDMAAVTKAMADKIESTFAGASSQLLIVQDTGAPAAKAMKGDATLAKDGTVTITDGAVTSRKVKLTAGVLAASADVRTKGVGEGGNPYLDVPGVSLAITPLVPAILLVTINVVASCPGTTGVETLNGSISVDAGAENARIAMTTFPEDGISREESCLQFYEVPLTAAAHAIKLRVKHASILESHITVKAVHTTMKYELYAA